MRADPAAYWRNKALKGGAWGTGGGTHERGTRQMLGHGTGPVSWGLSHTVGSGRFRSRQVAGRGCADPADTARRAPVGLTRQDQFRPLANPSRGGGDRDTVPVFRPPAGL
ncbi:hypothetical protein GCM10010524_56320 [Streptomyces mexicanus]